MKGIIVALLLCFLGCAFAQSGYPSWKSGTCVISGDPHITTIDGYTYETQSRNTWNNLFVSPEVIVIGHFYPCTFYAVDPPWKAKTSGVSCLDKVRVYSKSGDTVYWVEASQNEDKEGYGIGELDHDGHPFYVYVKDEHGNELTQVMPNGGKKSGSDSYGNIHISMGYTGGTYHFTMDTNDVKVTMGRRWAVINPTTRYLKKTCGLCGTYSQKQSDDFFTPSYKYLNIHNQISTFAKDWEYQGLKWTCQKPPTKAPTHKPTKQPTHPPTRKPTHPPTGQPTKVPTKPPVVPPTKVPTQPPSNPPTQLPTPPPSNPPTFPPGKPTPTATSAPTATLVPTPTATRAPTATPPPATLPPTDVPTPPESSSESEGTTGSSEGTTTGSSEGTTGSSESQGTTGSSEGTTTGSSESEGTSTGSSEGTTTGSSEGTSTGNSEGTSTGNSEGTTSTTSGTSTTGDQFSSSENLDSSYHYVDTDSSVEADSSIEYDFVDNSTIVEPANITLNITYSPMNMTEWDYMVAELNSTSLWVTANTTCMNTGLVPWSDGWMRCMFDILQTGSTSTAIDSLLGYFFSCNSSDTSEAAASCANGTLLLCPDACNAHGTCAHGVCNCDSGYEGDTCTTVPLLTTAQTVGIAIGAASVVGIAIGAAAFVVLGGFGAKKGYDYLKAGNNQMSNLHTNPLYQENKTGGQNPFYDKA